MPISALQHYLYCPRQCGLIHLERIWTENVHTAEGRLLHARVDTMHAGTRRGVRCVTALPIAHEPLGVHGVADMVEFDDRTTPPVVRPIEYKRGAPKAHRADEVQLCAQALCLEAMFRLQISAGAVFYGERRRRTDVVFDSALRSLTLETIDATRRMLRDGRTPSAVHEPGRCGGCSLQDQCMPRVQSRGRDVDRWFRERLRDDFGVDGGDALRRSDCANS